MKELLNKYENKRPEIVFEWKDSESEAEGWIVINSLRGGAAGGGTRMRKGLDRREVESLAKTMEVKFTVAGPAIGGAKSGINFDPADPRKRQVLERWFKAALPILKTYYGTGGDMNVDEIHDVIAITKNYGLLHPQEGVVRGHFGSSAFDSGKSDNFVGKKISNLQQGVVKLVTDKKYVPQDGLTVSDMITGYGVAESVRHYYSIWGGDVKGKRAIIQGWGNVASAAAYYLGQMGAVVTGIIDREGGIFSTEGLNFEELTKLFLEKDGNKLRSDKMIGAEEISKKVWSVGAEIFIPAAASRLVTREQVEAMVSNGLEVVACGANVPFADKEIFFGPIGEYTDNQVSLIPDFISNCGMARVFAYLMSDEATLTDEAIFSDVSRIIGNAMKETHEQHKSKTGIAQAAFGIALNKLL
jgi:glutamate dehydrogenase/leucine dehydrogenase